MYIRYVDNLMFISGSSVPDVQASLLREREDGLVHYTRELEKIDSQCITFVDMEIYKGSLV